ncbi:hypothetical protein TorRG33x02_215390 [Trema orientale]|uniref:Uncharacterized protein n=1 Tax=Trema orientale TaxID=63057 RepID=A0A2P5EB45_TREOI|nr:hypothetical protein TorRG33x02_215390 [Trema orientale]
MEWGDCFAAEILLGDPRRMSCLCCLVEGLGCTRGGVRDTVVLRVVVLIPFYSIVISKALIIEVPHISVWNLEG